MTAYFLWMQEEGREEIKKENPDIGITEVAKAGGEKWRNLDEDTKKKYEEKHKELKDKYDEEYKEWYESGGKEAKNDWLLIGRLLVDDGLLRVNCLQIRIA